MDRPENDLWSRLRARSAEAHASNALYRIESQPHYVTDGGVEFVVRMAIDFERQMQVMPRNRPGNPFLPPDTPLYLGDVTPTHYALLNKYHVIESHLLVVTREYVDQEVLLDLADFEALVACLPRDQAAIGFYNGGRGSGASQPHKHLQIVTLPLSPRAEIPMAPLLAGSAPRLPFAHAFVRVERGDATALHECYRRLLAEAGLRAVGGPGPERQPHPYNVVIAADWMLLVPRSRESFEGIPLNSLAFVGAFFVRKEAQLEAVRRIGPMAVLAQAAG